MAAGPLCPRGDQGMPMPTRSKTPVQGFSIVFVGAFNPAILNPDWLAARGLLRTEEATAAEVVVITPDLTVFKAAWLELEVTRERFIATTRDPSNLLGLSEVVAGIFGYLEHTPLRQMGLNTRSHYPIGSLDEWHALGDMLVPKDTWRDVLPGDRADGLPGLRSLTVQGIRPDAPSKFVNFTVEPSVRLQPGLYVASNEHFEANDPNTPADLLDHLRACWEPAVEFAQQIANHLVSRVERT